MNRWLALVLVALVLAVPAASADAWPQTSHDAATTGHADVDGPATNDTAFTVRLPGGLHTGAILGPPEPLILDDHAYVAVQPTDEDDGLDARGIARVNLATAEVETLVETNRTPQHLASAYGRIYAVRDGGMDAYDPETGEHLWGTPHPQQVVEHERTRCQAPAVANGLVYVACTEEGTAEQGEVDTGEQDPASPPPQTIPFVWFVNATIGEHLATAQLIPDEPSQEADSTIQDPESGATESRASPIRFAAGISVAGGQVYAVTGQAVESGYRCDPDRELACAEVSSFNIRLWALDADSYEVHWTNRTQTQRATTVSTSVAGTHRPVDDAQLPVAARVTATDRMVYTKLDGQLQARSPADGQAIWSEELGEADLEGNVGGMSSALVGEALYSASAQTLYRFDTDVEVNAWQIGLDPALEEEFTWGSVMATDDTVYAMAHDYGDQSALYAVRADDGEQVFRHALEPLSDDYRTFSFMPFSYALADGVVVIAGYDGTLRVVGETAASLEPAVEASSAYPAPGENVTVDLSGTQAGALGNATAYRAVWGDGNATDWQEDPGLTHAYGEPGNLTARFVVANDNQTASTTHTFHVGQEAPTEPNWLAERFEDDNQDMTFGVIGVALALGGGAIGVARRRRKRSNLEAELEALEEGFEELEDKPGECEAFLDNRKARARSLAIDGYLEEQHVPVIESRAEELRGQLRTSMLDERFQFLPHGMVQSLKRMLTDGQINAWERDTIETLLEEDEALNAAQKERVRGLLERWSASGGPDGGGSS